MELIKKILGPFTNINFGKLFISQFMCHLADILVILYLFVHTMGTKNIYATNILFLAYFIPLILFSPFLGKLEKHISKNKILLCSVLIRLAACGLLFLISQKFILSLNLYYVFAFLIGIGSAMFYPAQMSLIPELIPPKQLSYANALNSSSILLAIFAGIVVLNFIIPQKSNIFFPVILLMYLISTICIFIKQPKLTPKIFRTKLHKKGLYITAICLILNFIIVLLPNTLNSLITDTFTSQKDLITWTQLRTAVECGILTAIGGIILVSIIKPKKNKMPALSLKLLCAALLVTLLCIKLETLYAIVFIIGILSTVIRTMLDTTIQRTALEKGFAFGVQNSLFIMSFVIGNIISLFNIIYLNLIQFVDIIKVLSVEMSLVIIAMFVFSKSFRRLFK